MRFLLTLILAPNSKQKGPLNEETNIQKMPTDDEFANALNMNITELQSILRVYKETNIPKSSMNTLHEIQKQLSGHIKDINSILQPRVAMKVSALLNKAEKPKKKFSRVTFYSSDSPYINRRDKSNSYRIVPPTDFKSPITTTAKNVVSSQFLLNSLQLLENIRNLERLQGTSTEDVSYSNEGS